MSAAGKADMMVRPPPRARAHIKEHRVVEDFTSSRTAPKDEHGRASEHGARRHFTWSRCRAPDFGSLPLQADSVEHPHIPKCSALIPGVIAADVAEYTHPWP
jgi:hypothetical protein